MINCYPWQRFRLCIVPYPVVLKQSQVLVYPLTAPPVPAEAFVFVSLRLVVNPLFLVLQTDGCRNILSNHLIQSPLLWRHHLQAMYCLIRGNRFQ
jgi:hypothetical protein